MEKEEDCGELATEATATVPPSKPQFGNVETSHHLLQVVGNDAYESHTDVPFVRTLDINNAPREPYRRRTHEEKSVLHWGQRKLLLSEIEFLTLYGHLGNTVVYAGAAPGSHTPYLIELFPKLRWVLVDPAPFSSKLLLFLKHNKKSDVVLLQEEFTDDLAKDIKQKYSGGSVSNESGVKEGILFLSDVRSCDWLVSSQSEVEKGVWADMCAQQRWHEILEPGKSMLKFRLPWHEGKSRYLAGDIHLPMFGPITTTETRLVPSQGYKEWDNYEYMEQMFFFNTRTRVNQYWHDAPVGDESDGFDYCYDCRAEVHVLSQYLKKVANKEGSDLIESVVSMSKDCSHHCGSGKRKLSDRNIDPAMRKEGIDKRKRKRRKR
eukprot:m.5971 g.5971  ORF g.5971 m.5971 type:complete len:377 (-) comp3455_c0_seq1:16-1146(-)